MKTFYTVKDGKIDRIQTGDSPAGNAVWQEAPENWGGAHGDKLEWFDSAMRRIPDHELISQGKRKDKRGRWYHKDKIGETKQVYGLDEEPGDNFTQEAPIENESHQKFDRQLNHWIVDAEKKELAEKESKLAEVQAEIEDTEKKMVRSMRAIISNRATEEDMEIFNRYDTLIETELRPKLARLDSELKSA